MFGGGLFPGFLIIGGLIVMGFGAVAIFDKDLAWRVTRWQNALRGLESKRTREWETMTTVSGVTSILLGLFLIVLALV